MVYLVCLYESMREEMFDKGNEMREVQVRRMFCL